MTSNNPSQAVQSQISNALSTSGASPGAVNALTNSIQGLLSNPTPAGISNAVIAFNTLIGGANAAFLANPPAEFQAIFATLSQIVSAGNAATSSR
jgi:hypothetical protein